MRTDSLSEFIFREIKEMALEYGKAPILMPFFIILPSGESYFTIFNACLPTFTR